MTDDSEQRKKQLEQLLELAIMDWWIDWQGVVKKLSLRSPEAGEELGERIAFEMHLMLKKAAKGCNEDGRHGARRRPTIRPA